MIYRFVPGFGDEIAGSRNNRIMQGAEGKAAAVISSPAALVAQGIKTHSARSRQQRRRQAQGAGGRPPAQPRSGGVAAHSSRTPTAAADLSPPPHPLPAPATAR